VLNRLCDALDVHGATLLRHARGTALAPASGSSGGPASLQRAGPRTAPVPRL